MTINVGWELVNWRIVHPDYRGEARKGRGRRGNSGQGVGPISSACPWSQSRTGEAVRDLDGNCFRLFPYSRISSRPTRSELGKQHRRRGEPNANANAKAKDLSWLGCMSGKHPVKQFPTQTSLVLTVLTPCNPARPACYSPAQPSLAQAIQVAVFINLYDHLKRRQRQSNVKKRKEKKNKVACTTVSGADRCEMAVCICNGIDL